MGIFKILLIVSVLTFVLTWSMISFSSKEKLGRTLYPLTLLSQISVVIYMTNTSILNQPDLWLMFLIYSLIFNVIFVFYHKGTVDRHWFPFLVNIILLSSSIWGLPAEIVDSGYHTDKTYLIHLILGGISFGLVCLAIYQLIITEVRSLLKFSKLTSLIATLFWIFKLVTYGLWAEWLWGRFWSGLFFEYQLVLVLLLLLVNLVFIVKDTWFNKSAFFIILILVAIFMVIPFYLLEPHHSGYA